MSYDLYFCARVTRGLSFDEVAAWSRRYAFFKQSGETQLFYEDDRTGVYFSLEYSEPGERSELDIPADVFDTGLTFNLNYIRPSFFALEAMPIAEALARQFDLVMFDPQGEPSIGGFSSEVLVESWSKSNRWAVGAMASEDPTGLFYLPPSTSAEFWTYMCDYSRFSKELESQDVFVPQQLLFSVKNSQQASTAIVWTEGIHLIIPRTDWIIVMFPKSFWRKESEMVCFKSEAVLTPMTEYLLDFDADRNIRMLPPENLKRASKVLKALRDGLGIGDLKRLQPDKCVDVPFGQFGPA
jgi:hypothetical protein